jgi:hypothetical protein
MAHGRTDRQTCAPAAATVAPGSKTNADAFSIRFWMGELHPVLGANLRHFTRVPFPPCKTPRPASGRWRLDTSRKGRNTRTCCPIRMTHAAAESGADRRRPRVGRDGPVRGGEPGPRTAELKPIHSGFGVGPDAVDHDEWLDGEQRSLDPGAGGFGEVHRVAFRLRNPSSRAETR